MDMDKPGSEPVDCPVRGEPGRCGSAHYYPGSTWKTFQRSIPKSTLEELKALRRTDNWRNVGYLGFDWAIICAAAAPALVLGDPWTYATRYLPL